MVKNLSYRYREIVPVQRYISFTGIYHWYGKKMRNPNPAARRRVWPEPAIRAGAACGRLGLCYDLWERIVIQH